MVNKFNIHRIFKSTLLFYRMKNKINKPDLKYIKIKRSKVHGTGIFAKQNIKKDTKIIEYVGELVSKKVGSIRAKQQFNKHLKDHNAGSVYVFELNKKYDIDGNVPYNIARFINHSCNPNCKFKIIKDHIWIVSIKNIKKGVEINYNYGYDLEDYECHPCSCHGKDCLGYIIGEEYRKRLLKKLTKKSRSK